QLLWESNGVRGWGDCTDIVKTAAVDIGAHLMADPETPPCPACPTCPPVPPPTPRTPPVVTPEPADPSRPLVMLGGGVVLAFESPFSVAPGVSLVAGVRWPNVSLAVEPRVVFPGAGDTQGERVNMTSFAAVLAACVHHRLLFGCGLAEGGALHLSGADAPSG